MSLQKGNNSSLATLSALAGVMFFAPFVKHNLSKENSLSPEERSFVLGYTQIGYVNLIFLGIIIIASISNIFLHYTFLTRIVNICGYAIGIISSISIISCAYGKSMRKENESIMQPISHKKDVLKSFLPLWNFSLRFHQKDYSMPYRWLKESILLRTAFIFLTILLGSSVGIGMLIIIVVRFLLLMLNIDIIPNSMKRSLNNIFSCNPEEFIAYIFAPLTATIKKIDYFSALKYCKDQYAQGQKFGIGIILQYILFIGILVRLYFGYKITIESSVVFLAMFIRLVRIFLFYKSKKTFLRIPILSEITSTIFRQ